MGGRQRAAGELSQPPHSPAHAASLHLPNLECARARFKSSCSRPCSMCWTRRMQRYNLPLPHTLSRLQTQCQLSLTAPSLLPHPSHAPPESRVVSWKIPVTVQQHSCHVTAFCSGVRCRVLLCVQACQEEATDPSKVPSSVWLGCTYLACGDGRDRWAVGA